MRALVHLDFVDRKPRQARLGAALLAVGAVALIAVLLLCRSLEQRSAGLALQIEARSPSRHLSPDSQVQAARESAMSARTAEELATPWTQLLAELETASKDNAGQVAVLSVEPDHAKHKVHLKGEAQNLELTIAYLERLQRAGSLRYPMLDSHELRSDDPQHPVRFEVTADWEDGS
jgi:hypothetical protein